MKTFHWLRNGTIGVAAVAAASGYPTVAVCSLLVLVLANDSEDRRLLREDEGREIRATLAQEQRRRFGVPE